MMACMRRTVSRRARATAEWKKELDPLQHHVLRKHGTERAFTSPLNNEKRPGTFRCAGCGEPLFEFGNQIRKRLGLAVVLGADAGRRRHLDRRQPSS